MKTVLLFAVISFGGYVAYQRVSAPSPAALVYEQCADSELIGRGTW